VTKTNDGGAAFPGQACGSDGLPMFEAEYGMTLRDWFAGQALVGLLAQSNGSATQSDLVTGARWSYAMADAMLQAREASNAAS